MNHRSLLSLATGLAAALAAGPALAAPTVYAGNSDGTASVVDDATTTNYTPTGIPLGICHPVDGVADPGGKLVWFASSCGAVVTVNTDTNAVTTRIVAP